MKGFLVRAVMKENKISKSQAEIVVESFVEQVSKALKKEQKITLAGFGTFSYAKRKQRAGRNPQTGEAIKIPRKVALFKPHKALRPAIK